LDPVQIACWHVNVPKHLFAGLGVQVLPSALMVSTHPPAAKLHDAVRHGLVLVHCFTGLEQPVTLSHVPATWQASCARHVRGTWVHAPALHCLTVHALGMAVASSHSVPSIFPTQSTVSFAHHVPNRLVAPGCSAYS
jgi:hypothetical protein